MNTMRFEIQGKTGTYVVKFDKVSHHMYHMNLWEWSCTCGSYQKGKKLTCKHIKRIQSFLKIKETIRVVTADVSR